MPEITIMRDAAVPHKPLGFGQAVTTASSPILASNYTCYAVLVQSSTKNDANSTMSGIIYVEIEGVKAYELVQGQEILIPCSQTDQIQVVTQTGTAFARGFVYR